MAETYQTEEEQVQAIKDWWKANGKAIIAGLIIGLGGIGGWRWWTDHQKTQSEQASLIYAQVIDAAARGNVARVTTEGQKILEQYAGTPYATLTALLLARAAVEKQDDEAAVAHLQWVIDRGADEGFRHLARLRLARVRLQQDQPAAALALLGTGSVPGFDALYSDVRGDAYRAQQKPALAAAEYRKALLDGGLNRELRSRIEMKLNEVATAVGDTA